MSTIDDLVNYVTTTPSNTNPHVVRIMAQNLVGNNTSSEDSQLPNITGSKGVNVVDYLPENADNGDLYLATKEVSNSSTTISQATFEAYDGYIDLEGKDGYYDWCDSKNINVETEEDKIAARNNTTAVAEYIEDEFEKFDNDEIIMSVRPSFPENLSNITSDDLKYFVDTKDPDTDNETGAKTYNSQVVSFANEQDEDDAWVLDIGVLGSIQALNRAADDGKAIVPLDEGTDKGVDEGIDEGADEETDEETITDKIKLESFFIIANDSNSDNITLIPFISGSQYAYSIDNKYRVDQIYFYIPNSGSYILINDLDTYLDLNNDNEPDLLKEFTVTDAGWYSLCFEANDLDDLDDGNVFLNIVPVSEENVKFKKVNCFNDDIIKLSGNVKLDANGKLTLGENTCFIDQFFDCYESKETGLFIRNNNNWEKVLTGELPKDSFLNLVTDVDKGIKLIGADTSGDVFNLNGTTLTYKVMEFDEDSGEYDERTQEISLASLAGTDLRIQSISRDPSYSDPNNLHSGEVGAWYKVEYSNYDDNDSNTYFHFWVEDATDLSNYALAQDIPSISNLLTINNYEIGRILFSPLTVSDIETNYIPKLNTENKTPYNTTYNDNLLQITNTFDGAQTTSKTMLVYNPQGLTQNSEHPFIWEYWSLIPIIRSSDIPAAPDLSNYVTNSELTGYVSRSDASFNLGYSNFKTPMLGTVYFTAKSKSEYSTLLGSGSDSGLDVSPSTALASALQLDSTFEYGTDPSSVTGVQYMVMVGPPSGSYSDPLFSDCFWISIEY